MMCASAVLPTAASRARVDEAAQGPGPLTGGVWGGWEHEGGVFVGFRSARGTGWLGCPAGGLISGARNGAHCRALVRPTGRSSDLVGLC